MNTPKIRFKGFKDDWEQRKFGELFSRRMERNLGQFDNTRWISVARMYFQDPDRVTSNNIDTRTYVMREGDIAFEGHSNQEYRYGRFVANDIGDGVISELFPIYQHIVPYDNNYWKYAIQIETIMAPKILRCIEISYTSSNKLDEKFFLEESTSVPGIEEQRKIGALLSNLDNLIALHQRKCDETKQLKKFMLQKMFPKNGEKNPKIRFEGFTDDWEQRKFSELVTIERGGSPRPIDRFITKEENGLNWIKIGDAPEQGNYITKTEEKIKPEGLSKTREVHPGDLILSNSMSFGRPYILAIDGCIHDGWLAIRDTEKRFDLKFLCTLLGTDNMLSQYKAMAAGSTVNNLNKELVGATTVSYPVMDEQVKLGEFFDGIDHLITLHQRKCEKLKELKKYMLHNMFV